MVPLLGDFGCDRMIRLVLYGGGERDASGEASGYLHKEGSCLIAGENGGNDVKNILHHPIVCSA